MKTNMVAPKKTKKRIEEIKKKTKKRIVVRRAFQDIKTKKRIFT